MWNIPFIYKQTEIPGKLQHVKEQGEVRGKKRPLVPVRSGRGSRGRNTEDNLLSQQEAPAFR